MFAGVLLHGFVLLVGGGAVHRLTVAAVGRVVFCGRGVLGLLGLRHSVLSRGHAAVPAETAETCVTPVVSRRWVILLHLTLNNKTSDPFGSND